MHAAACEPELCHGLDLLTASLYNLMDFSFFQKGIIIIVPIFSSKISKAGAVNPKIQKHGGRVGRGLRKTRHLGGGEQELGSDPPK